MTMFSMWYTALGTFLQAVLLGCIYGEQARMNKIYKPKQAWECGALSTARHYFHCSLDRYKVAIVSERRR